MATSTRGPGDVDDQPPGERSPREHAGPAYSRDGNTGPASRPRWGPRPCCGVTAPRDSFDQGDDANADARSVGETDLMGIVHHGSYLVDFELGRVEWLRRRGVTYADWASRGVHLPVVDARLAYRAPARFKDHCRCRRDRRSRCCERSRWRSITGFRRETTLIAEGSTRLGCIDGGHKLLEDPGDDALRAPRCPSPGSSPGNGRRSANAAHVPMNIVPTATAMTTTMMVAVEPDDGARRRGM